MRACNERRRDDHGAVAVEFALLLPFILGLLAGMFDFALAFNAQIQVSQAAQAGARASALNLPPAIVIQRAQGASPGLALTVVAPGCDAATQTAAVTVSHDFTLPIPIPGVPSPVTLAQRAVTPCTPAP